MMTTIKWVGRGGQGAFTAARLAGCAFSQKEGYYSLAFPSFGPERRGAPVHAYTKLDTKPILNRSEPETADYTVYLDDTLLGSDRAANGDGVLLVNTRKKPDDRFIGIDAEEIALRMLKLPITNTIMLGALSALLDRLTLADIERAIRITMPEKLRDRNIEAVREAYRRVQLLREVRQ